MKLRKEFAEWFRRKFQREILEIVGWSELPYGGKVVSLIVTDGNSVRACILQTANIPDGCRP